MDTPIKLVHLSDTHIFADASQSLLGVNTTTSLQAVIDLIHCQEKMDLMVHSGDLSQDGTATSYQALGHALKRFKVPIYCVPGNHDDPVTMYQTLPVATLSEKRQIKVGNWKFILLNSQKPLAVYGFLEKEEMDFLQRELKADPSCHTIIVFHHHPVSMGALWLDKIGLQNAADFWKIIAPFPQVKAVLFGHVHQENEQIFQNVKCLSSPSTCIQFMPRHDTFGLENVSQGYRWLHLYNDGRLETGVKRLPMYVGEYMGTAKGY